MSHSIPIPGLRYSVNLSKGKGVFNKLRNFQIKGLRGMCSGVHTMAIGWKKKVPALLDAAVL